MFEDDGFCTCFCGCDNWLFTDERICESCDEGWHVDTYDETLDEIELGGEG